MKTSKLIIGALSAFVFSMSASASIVDLFTDPAGGQVVSDDTNGADADNAANFSESGSFASIIGGYRDLKADALSGASDTGACDTGDDCTVLRVLNGRLTFNNDTGVTGTGIVQWDGQDNSSELNHGGLNNENLYTQEGCGEGCDAFVFTVYQSDQDFPFLIGIYTDENTFTEFLLAANAANEDEGTDYTSVLDFAFFENAQALGLCDAAPGDLPAGVLDVNCGTSGDADLSNVGAMQVVLNAGDAPTVAVDLEIGSITKTGVPEPGMIALLGLGFAAGGLVRARRRKSS